MFSFSESAQECQNNASQIFFTDGNVLLLFNPNLGWLFWLHVPFNRYNSLMKLKKIKLFYLHRSCETLLSNQFRRI